MGKKFPDFNYIRLTILTDVLAEMRMQILNYLESKFSINVIILTPIFVGLIMFLFVAIFLPVPVKTTEVLANVGLFLGGFSGLLMVHYKHIPGGNVDTRVAVFLGWLTTILCWGNFVYYLIQDLKKILFVSDKLACSNSLF